MDGQAESGFIPSPTFRTQDLTTCKLEEQARYIFDNSYHTTLVIIMAGLLWLKRYQLPLAVSKIPELSSLINKQ